MERCSHVMSVFLIPGRLGSGASAEGTHYYPGHPTNSIRGDIPRAENRGTDLTLTSVLAPIFYL